MPINPKPVKLILNNYSQSEQKFNKAKIELSGLSKKYDYKIEHFGSTAIPGTIGKGMIDIMVAFDNEEDQLDALKILQKAGYRRGELNKKPDGRFFLCSNQEQSEAGDVHLHLVIKESENFLKPVIFKDYLIKHPDLVIEYNKIKEEIVKATNSNRKEYAQNKRDFIDSIVSKIKNRP